MAQPIKLSKFANISTEIVWYKPTRTEKMKSLLNYAQAIDENCSLQFVNVRITDIFDEKMSSNFLAANCRVIYVCYIRAGKVMIK